VVSEPSPDRSQSAASSCPLGARLISLPGHKTDICGVGGFDGQLSRVVDEVSELGSDGPSFFGIEGGSLL
jgi:hypothetical protein